MSEHLCDCGNETLCPACESPCVATQRMGGEMYLAHPVYACPKDLVEESNQLRARVERLEKALNKIADDSEIHSDGKGSIKCIPCEACDCAKEWAKEALQAESKEDQAADLK